MTHSKKDYPSFASLLQIVGALSLCAISISAPSISNAQASVESLETCFFDMPNGTPNITRDCGYIVLPENPKSADSPDIKLAFIRMPARTADPKAPFFMLAGGPGGTFIEPSTFLLFGDTFLGPILDERDVILLDQRGAPNAIPSLYCPALNSLPWTVHERGLDEDAALELGRSTLADCVARTESDGIDLGQYNSVRIAADVNAARAALGYDQIVFYGASYGAQLAQHYMRDFPETLEAAVLDGANSLSRKSWVQERVRDVDVAMAKLAALCEADTKCGEAYDVLGMVDAAMALFDEGPIETTFQDPENPETQIDVVLTERDLAETIFGFQSGQIGIHALPAVLNVILADGRTSAADLMAQQKGSAILASRGATEGGLPILMHMAVICSDDPVTSPSDMIVDDDASRFARAFGEVVLEEYLESCAVVDVPPLPDSTDVDVETDVPTLILAGDLDARTPVIRSELVAEKLPRGIIVEFPEGTHVQLGEINQCAGEILRAFLTDPEGEIDTTCITEMPRRGFVLPDGTISNQ